MKTLMFTDIDNTVIYSHRHEFRGERVWVEKMHGKAQSYMTDYSYHFFLRQNWLNVVPVTTRTREQYARIRELSDSMRWKNVLICNGSILMENMRENQEWTQESMQIALTGWDEYVKAKDIARMLVGDRSITATEPFLFYFKSQDIEADYCSLREKHEWKYVQILKDERKIYCFPKLLNKGTAIQRYMKKIDAEYCFAAGDSEFDIPMLNCADVSFYPQWLGKCLDAKGEKYCCDGLLADCMCERLNIMKMRMSDNG